MTARALSPPSRRIAVLSGILTFILALPAGAAPLFRATFRSFSPLGAGTNCVQWPAYSLESGVHHMVDAKPTEVNTVILTWFGGEVEYPWEFLWDLVNEGMSRRGLLEARKERELIFNTVTRYALPERSRLLAQQQSMVPIHTLLDTCRQTRPQVWNLLMKQIHVALWRRTAA